jgi:hypothetical protein
VGQSGLLWEERSSESHTIRTILVGWVVPNKNSAGEEEEQGLVSLPPSTNHDADSDGAVSPYTHHVGPGQGLGQVAGMKLQKAVQSPS